MCGIAGIVSDGGFAGTGEAGSAARDAVPSGLTSMVRALAHRGPDDEGFLVSPPAALGHRRLSIIDIEGGHQPLSNDDGTVHIVYNGEIYNFPELKAGLEAGGVRFRTRSDTEVVLRLYEKDGPRCVERLRGMFAFAIWDAPRRRLVLARDRIGIKPLFFCETPGGFAFASEVKGLLAGGLIEPEIDLQALYHYISLRFIPDRMTLFRGISKLPAAHVLVREDGRARLEKYWSISYSDKLTGSEHEIADGLEEVLRDAVSCHTLSDVPVGAFLSGGIDSSLVTALLSGEAGGPVPTFSIGVEEQDWSELPFARQVAEQYGTDHHERVVRADLVRLLPRMIHHMDEPSDPFGAGVFLVSKLASEHVKVVMSGDGGDELFAGYDRFAGNRLVDLYCVLPAFLRRTLFRRLAELIPDSYGYKSLAQKVRWMNEMSLVDHGERYARSMSFLRFTEEAKARLFRPDALSEIPQRDSRPKILEHYEAEGVEDMVDRMLHTDCMTRMPDHLLLIVDRMAMAHGLEARPPILDHKVIEFAARVPGGFKLKGRRLKHILRVVAGRHLPSSLIERRKQGFGFPLATWMRHDLRPLLGEVLGQSRFVRAGLFERAEVDRILEEHVSGRSDHNFRLWILLNLEIWHRMYLERQGPEDVLAWMEPHLPRHAARDESASAGALPAAPTARSG